MGINGLGTLFNALKSSKSVDQKIIQVMNKLAKGNKRIRTPRMTFDKRSMAKLPEDILEFSKGLKNPRITCGLNCGNGQSVMGFKIQDGNEVVGNFAFSLTRNNNLYPNIQARLQIFNKNQKAIGGSLMVNPSGKMDGDFINTFSSRKGTLKVEQVRGDAIHFDASLNTEAAKGFAQRIGGNMSDIPEPLKEMQKDPDAFLKMILENFKKETAKLNKSTINKSKSKTKIKKNSNVSAINSHTQNVNQRTFATEAEQIMKFPGKPTEATANQAKDILMKRMGYDPDLITVKVSDEIAGHGGQFNYATGELLLDGSLAAKATHFDIADVLAHELDHMDIAVKTAKYMGIDEYEKLVMYRKTADDVDIVFNKEFYKRAIAQANIEGFNAKPYIQEEKEINRLFDRNLSGKYLSINQQYAYATSKNEGHARDVEKRLIAELQKRGVEIKSSIPLEDFGKTPHQFIVNLMPSIEAKLAKYPLSLRNDKFNEAYFKSLEEFNPEFAKLEKKYLTEGLTEKIEYSDGRVETLGECSRHKELWQEIFGGKNGTKNRTEILKRTIELI